MFLKKWFVERKKNIFSFFFIEIINEKKKEKCRKDFKTIGKLVNWF